MPNIELVAKQNPWWIHGAQFAHYDQHLSTIRPIFFQRKSIQLQKGNIYLLRGCRQTGKTTYIKGIIKNLIEKGTVPQDILYISLDFFPGKTRKELRNTIDYFLNSTYGRDRIYIFFDEITKINGWHEELKYLYDVGIIQRSCILATGSSASKLKEQSELLPGRGMEGNEYYLQPFSFRDFIINVSNWHRDGHSFGHISTSGEFWESIYKVTEVLQKHSIDFESDPSKIKDAVFALGPFIQPLHYFFNIYLSTGGIPKVINNFLENLEAANQIKFNPDIATIFIKTLLGDLSNLEKKEATIRQILSSLLAKYGSRFSINTLSAEAGSNHSTIEAYLGTLESSFILYTLYAYDFNSKDIKYKSNKKVYFFDPFLMHAIRSYLTGGDISAILTEAKMDTQIVSSLVEGIVISHLLLNQQMPYTREKNSFLWYYYSASNGKEIDAVMKAGKNYYAFEVKYSDQAEDRTMHIIPQINENILLSRNHLDVQSKILIIPVDIFLALLSPSTKHL